MTVTFEKFPPNEVQLYAKSDAEIEAALSEIKAFLAAPRPADYDENFEPVIRSMHDGFERGVVFAREDFDHDPWDAAGMTFDEHGPTFAIMARWQNAYDQICFAGSPPWPRWEG